MTDPYLSLEESTEAISFAKSASSDCLKSLGNPTVSRTARYSDILQVLEADDRIPFVSKMSVNEKGEDELYNLWKDSKNRRGIWRKTTMSSYQSSSPRWETVLDLDKLSREEGVDWVWKGSRVLPRARDPWSEDAKRVTRVLITLGKATTDSVVVREFDLLASQFVQDSTTFMVPESKTRASYKSRDVLLVSSDYGPASLTDSGYPRTIREWQRGTDLANAPVVFEGESSDVAVSSYINDQRVRGGGLYEVRTRALTFQTSIYLVRKIKPEHLLAHDDPERGGVSDPSDFKKLEVPLDAEIDFVGNLLLVTLRSAWSVSKSKRPFPAGSIVYVNAHKFIKYGPKDRIYHVLFQPSERTSCETYCVTKQFCILMIMVNARTRMDFYRLEKDANKLRLVGTDKVPQIRAVTVRAYDPYEGDRFWFTTTGYTEPSTLWLGDASKVDPEEKKLVRRMTQDPYVIQKIMALPERFDPSNLTVEQRVTKSKDGTEIPYFIIMKKDITMNKKNPTLLYGYGGFEVSVGPHYIAATGIAWLMRGGVYVEAIIRGGGEFGPSWHQAGIRENRHKSYEDFIAVAEDLINARVCKPRTLAIRGGSNGGLLVANMYVMRPELFAAVHCAVPLLDMRRYKAMSAGQGWVTEFGDPDTEDWDKFLKKYSPYHNIDETKKKYPPILFTTNTRDEMVHPGHARKMVKKLWDLGEGKKWPTYYYENMETGTGGVDAKQYAFMTALAYEFLFKTIQKSSQKSGESK